MTKTPVATVDGNSVRVCTFATDTTCQAHADYRKKRCGTPKQGDPNDVDVEGTADNALCGAEGLNDGYCVFSEGFKQYLCSVPCSNNVSDCPAINPSASCDNVAPDLAICSL